MIRQSLSLEEALLELLDFQLHENKQTNKVRQQFTHPKEKRAMISQRTKKGFQETDAQSINESIARHPGVEEELVKRW